MNDFLSKKLLKKSKFLKSCNKHIRKIHSSQVVIVSSVVIIFLFVTITFFIIKIDEAQVRLIPSQELYKTPLPYVSKDVTVNTTAKALVVYDPQSRTFVYGKNATYRFSPASTAKIMTATLAIEHYNLHSILEANGVTSVVGSKMGLFEDEQMSVRNLLYGLLLPSGNDAAFVLAEHYPGGESAFVKAMNAKAKKLYLYNTHFVDPAGYDDSNYTTAEDLARLAAYAMQNSFFRTLVSTKNITVYNAQGTIPHELTNLNQLLGMKGIDGIKTGFTYEAGQVLVTAYTYQGKMYIIVVLESSDRFGDTEKIIKDVVSKIQLISY